MTSANETFSRLVDLFPTTPTTVIARAYVACEKDIGRTVDFLFQNVSSQHGGALSGSDPLKLSAGAPSSNPGAPKATSREAASARGGDDSAQRPAQKHGLGSFNHSQNVIGISSATRELASVGAAQPRADELMPNPAMTLGAASGAHAAGLGHQVDHKQHELLHPLGTPPSLHKRGSGHAMSVRKDPTTLGASPVRKACRLTDVPPETAGASHAAHDLEDKIDRIYTVLGSEDLQRDLVRDMLDHFKGDIEKCVTYLMDLSTSSPLGHGGGSMSAGGAAIRNAAAGLPENGVAASGSPAFRRPPLSASAGGVDVESSSGGGSGGSERASLPDLSFLEEMFPKAGIGRIVELFLLHNCSMEDTVTALMLEQEGQGDQLGTEQVSLSATREAAADVGRVTILDESDVLEQNPVAARCGSGTDEGSTHSWTLEGGAQAEPDDATSNLDFLAELFPDFDRSALREVLTYCKGSVEDAFRMLEPEEPSSQGAPGSAGRADPEAAGRWHWKAPLEEAGLASAGTHAHQYRSDWQNGARHADPQVFGGSLMQHAFPPLGHQSLHPQHQQQHGPGPLDSGRLHFEVDGRRPDAGDLYKTHRREAYELMQLRNQEIDLARAARRRRDYRATQAHQDRANALDDQAKAAMERAGTNIFAANQQKFRNHISVDFHHLHVDEALKELKRVLPMLSSGVVGSMDIVTGRGNHSDRGQPKIKPAVIEFLRREGFQWEERSGGGSLFVRPSLPCPS